MLTEIELFEYPDLTSLHFCLWGWMKTEGYKRKSNAPDESHFGCCCPHKESEDNSDEKHANFAHELQRFMELTVGFSKTVNCNNIFT